MKQYLEEVGKTGIELPTTHQQALGLVEVVEDLEVHGAELGDLLAQVLVLLTQPLPLYV